MSQTIWDFESGKDASSVADGTTATAANIGAQQVYPAGTSTFSSAAAVSGKLGMRTISPPSSAAVYRLQPGGGSDTSNQMAYLLSFRINNAAPIVDYLWFAGFRHAGGFVCYLRWLPDDSCVLMEVGGATVGTVLPAGSNRSTKRFYSVVINNSTGAYSVRVKTSQGTLINELSGTYNWPVSAAMGPVQLGVQNPLADSTSVDIDYVVIGLGESEHIALPSTNTPPVANAGLDQTVQSYSLVTLSGSGSDADGTIASGSWTQTSGSAVTLGGAGLTRTFTAPASVNGETLSFSLVVADNSGATSAADQMTVKILPHLEWLKTTGSLVPIRRSS